MLNLVDDIDTLTNFKRDTNRFLKQMRRTGSPVVLTVNGKAQIVVQDAASYQRLVELLDRAGTIAAVKEGLADAAAGRTRPARAVMDKLGRKYKLGATKAKRR